LKSIIDDAIAQIQKGAGMIEAVPGKRRVRFVFIAAGLVAVVVGATVAGQSVAPRKTWSDYGGGPDSAEVHHPDANHPG
jgi:hypothetical protein